jgi:hypothetical protein
MVQCLDSRYSCSLDVSREEVMKARGLDPHIHIVVPSQPY